MLSFYDLCIDIANAILYLSTETLYVNLEVTSTKFYINIFTPSGVLLQVSDLFIFVNIIITELIFNGRLLFWLISHSSELYVINLPAILILKFDNLYRRYQYFCNQYTAIAQSDTSFVILKTIWRNRLDEFSLSIKC